MKRSEAIRKASAAMAETSDVLYMVNMKLGRISRQALSEGQVSFVVNQMRKIAEVSKELADMCKILDWDIDEEKTIELEKKSIEEVN